MARGIDLKGLNSPAMQALRAVEPPAAMPFRVTKLGHVVLRAADLEHSLRFYTQVLGFKVSDVYPPTMVPDGMVFLRFNTDHHGRCPGRPRRGDGGGCRDWPGRPASPGLQGRPPRRGAARATTWNSTASP